MKKKMTKEERKWSVASFLTALVFLLSAMAFMSFATSTDEYFNDDENLYKDSYAYESMIEDFETMGYTETECEWHVMDHQSVGIYDSNGVTTYNTAGIQDLITFEPGALTTYLWRMTWIGLLLSNDINVLCGTFITTT